MFTDSARQEAREQAKKVYTLTVKEASKLSGILGRVCPQYLEYHGWYACSVDGVKTFFIRQEA